MAHQATDLRVRQSEEDALVVWVDSEDEKAILRRENPELFLTTPHYDGYAIVLARLDALDAAVADRAGH